jgi:hypothetical protein
MDASNAFMDFISKFTSDFTEVDSSVFNSTNNKFYMEFSDIHEELVEYGRLVAENLGFEVVSLSDCLYQFKEANGMETDYNLDIYIKIVDGKYEFSLFIYEIAIESDEED